MSFDPEKITFFAKTDARGQQVSFGIKAKDRQRHMYVVGKTGMGKSTLLENMAAQDIKNGEGMAFIDPHGSAAETLLDYVPEDRIDDVIYFAPFDMNHPISFNVMEDVGADKRHLVVSGLMSTFKKIWVDAWSARMEYILTNALLALIEYPDTTLLSVNRLFSDKAYRKQVVEYVKDPAVKAFWVEEYANYTERFAAEALPSIQNKIGQFTGNPLIRNIIGQPHSSFDIRDIMDNKKILIMNLSKGLIGETNANLLGSMLTTRIYLAAMSRADLPVAQMKTMPNFYFYVDEFQSFANATFANILSEARKYHLNLIIAHQYIAQMEEEVRDAVFGNVGTTVAFRVGPFDGEVLETVFSPRFLATDLVNLGFAQIYLTLMIDGIGSQPFSAVTLPPVEKPRVSSREMVIVSSRRNYTKKREQVEELVAELHTPVKVAPPVKKNNPANNNNNNGNGDYKNKRPVNKEFMPNAGFTKPALTPKVTRPTEEKPYEKHEKNDNSKPDVRPPYTSNAKNSRSTTNNFEKRDFKNKTEAGPRPKFESKGEAKLAPKVEPKPNFQKTPEDLRAILSRISDESNGKNNPDNKEKYNGHKDNSDHKSNKNHSEAQPKVDLKSALANVLKEAENKQITKPSESVIEKPAKSEVVTKAFEVKDEKTVRVVTQNSVNNEASKDSNENEAAKKQQHRDEIERLSAEVESIFGDLESSENNKSSSERKNFSQKNDDDGPLAPKKIEKMIKHSGKERSPFAS